MIHFETIQSITTVVGLAMAVYFAFFIIKQILK